MARLIHLNGAPGVGKSTIAARYVASHPGVLNCDVDRLRSFVGGWQDDFVSTGTIIRPVVLSMIGAHLDGGNDVVFPQMLADEAERARFRSVAVDSGHAYLHLLLQAGPGEAGARFFDRPPEDPVNAVIRGVVEAGRGAQGIDDLDRHLAATAAGMSDVVIVDAGGDVDQTYADVLRRL